MKPDDIFKNPIQLSKNNPAITKMDPSIALPAATPIIPIVPITKALMTFPNGEMVLTKFDVPKYISKEIQPEEQDHEQATFCKMITKEQGKIDWNKSARDIYNQWRAFTPWPGLFMEYKGNILKFIQIELTDIKDNSNLGEFVVKDKKEFSICSWFY